MTLQSPWRGTRTGVAAVLLDEVVHQAAQVCLATVRTGDVYEPVEPAAGEVRVERAPGPFDGAVPQRIQELRNVVGGGVELPSPDGDLAAASRTRRA